jgi:hypothetical protein
MVPEVLLASLEARRWKLLFCQLNTTHSPTPHCIKANCDQWRNQEFCSWGVQQIQLRIEDRERGSGGGSSLPYPLVKGSGGSCNLVQKNSFHIVKVS